MGVTVRFTDSAVDAERETRSFLHRDPIANNLVCTLLASRIASPAPIRFWWAEDGDEVLGVVFQSPSTVPAIVSLHERAVVPLAGGVAPDLVGVNGFVPGVARFAGEYATVKRRPGRAVEGQRVYVVETVLPPPAVDGRRRLATEDDVDVVAAFLDGFEADTGDVHGRAQERARHFVASGRLHLWEVHGEVVASTVAQAPVAGVVRVGFVYTPPARRRRGYAAALVAEVSQEVLAGGDRCMLFTQLSNPTSNAIYQRLGYRPVGEIVRYELG